MKRSLVLGAVTLASSLLVARAAHASLIWDGDASKGTDVFKLLNLETGATLAPASDATHGTVWRYSKPAGCNRSETHGIKVGGSGYTFAMGSTYYLGWRYKLTSLVDNNANFQWKAYGGGAGNPMLQNYPITVSMKDGKAGLWQKQPGAAMTQLWSKAIAVSSWHEIVLVIKVSDQTTGGYIELWWDGAQQTLTGGATRYYCRTFDCDHVCPKWGVYGALDTAVTNYVDALKVGTSLADAAPWGAAPRPTPTPTVTPGAPTPTPTPTPVPGGWSGYYKIVARHSGQTLNVLGASTANGADVIQWPYEGTRGNDQWQLVDLGNGYHRIVARHSGKVLNVSGASTANAANVDQWSWANVAQQQFQVVDLGNGYYRLVARHSGKVVNVAGASTASGANVDQWSWANVSQQQFQLVSVP